MTPVGFDPYNGMSYSYNIGIQTGAAAAASTGIGVGTGRTGTVETAENKASVVNPGESTRVMPGKKSSPAECKTCKERKYQDGSDEMVSFKSASHISPNAAGSAVRAHEGEHVSNAYNKAAKNGGKVMQASVAIHTSICPECGRTYVSGGTTTTKIKYGNEKNPYVQNMKNADKGLLSGMNFDVKG